MGTAPFPALPLLLRSSPRRKQGLPIKQQALTSAVLVHSRVIVEVLKRSLELWGDARGLFNALQGVEIEDVFAVALKAGKLVQTLATAIHAC